MFVSRGLVGPKRLLNRESAKGKLVNIPVPRVPLPNSTHRATLNTVVAVSKRRILGRTVMVRTGRMRDGVPFGGLRRMPGVREKLLGSVHVSVPRSDTGAPG